MWQEIAIIIIGTLASAYAGWKIYRLFAPSDKRTPCDSCRRDCPMKAPDRQTGRKR
ncbi:MAG: FeoB-associated Cys-rich membrane protein [Tannerella sp.]|nr:FeoB-associated Cys-rich membrane protein [Tannerella sp.]